jgi:hypothetical protein
MLLREIAVLPAKISRQKMFPQTAVGLQWRRCAFGQNGATVRSLAR